MNIKLVVTVIYAMLNYAKAIDDFLLEVVLSLKHRHRKRGSKGATRPPPPTLGALTYEFIIWIAVRLVFLSLYLLYKKFVAPPPQPQHQVKTSSYAYIKASYSAATGTTSLKNTVLKYSGAMITFLMNGSLYYDRLTTQ